MRWVLSLVATFAVIAYVGVWICGILLDRKKPDPIGLPQTPLPSHLELVQPLPTSVPEPALPPPVEQPKPEAALSISSTKTVAGEFLVVKLTGADGPILLETELGEQLKLPSDTHYALLAVKYTLNPGRYQVTATTSALSQNWEIEVLEKQWETQVLTVDPDVVEATVDSKAANDEYFEKVQPLKTRVESTPLWEGLFIEPLAQYRITTEFGLTRTINGTPAGDRHGGIDMAAPTGTPVMASNSGKVLFAQNIALTGNTVMIEHGLGLKTWYYHMDSIAVQEGQRIQKGDTVGAVGSTGFATGPHLHFAASVGKAYVNPHTLFQSEIPLF